MGTEFPNCRVCESLHAEYERATIARLQAEGDYLAAVHSGQRAAIDTTTATVERLVEQWIRAEAAMRRHGMHHTMAVAA